MSEPGKLEVVLCALTGFGNPVLEALLADARVHVGGVVTVEYPHPCPYYEERQLTELCQSRRVPCHTGVDVSSGEGLDLLRGLAPDVIVVATFRQILKDTVLSLSRLAVVNVHPSLLPRYRGPCPTHAALLDDERETGVTIHYLEARVDAGDVLLQWPMAIDQTDNDGTLRRKLAGLAAEMMPDLVGLFVACDRPAGRPQGNTAAPSRAPRPRAEDGFLERVPDIDGIRRRVRAFNPFPGTSILVEGRRISVDRFEILHDRGAVGFRESETAVDVVRPEGAIRLFKRTGPGAWFTTAGPTAPSSVHGGDPGHRPPVEPGSVVPETPDGGVAAGRGVPGGR